jgi:predicted RNA binding protein YcfA (HicA-like mRNA interferase family)
MPKIKNLKPAKCEKLLLKNGWQFINQEGTHSTFMKTINGKNIYCQVIWNNKTIYWKNADTMIKKSGIPESEWIKNCK